MGNWIELVSPPQRLYLAWQAPDHLKNRFRWAVGILTPNGGELDLAYLDGDSSEFESLNQGRSLRL